jgi:hypothetical protein
MRFLLSLALLFSLALPQPTPAQAATGSNLQEGGADAGGGNSVGEDFFDDYENQGTEVLPKEEIEALVAPYLAALKKKVPEFAEVLREGIKGTKWYLEPKELGQSGACVNQTYLKVNLVVRACQSRLAVRIDRDYFLANPKVQGPLALHELLVYQKLQKNFSGIDSKFAITDEGVREINRMIRDPSVPAQELRNRIREANFGDFFTASEHAHLKALYQRTRKAYCSKNIKATIKTVKKLMQEISSYKYSAGAGEDEYEDFIYNFNCK